MRELTTQDIASVFGSGSGVIDPNSTAYQIGHDVGVAIKDVGEVGGAIAFFMLFK